MSGRLGDGSMRDQQWRLIKIGKTDAEILEDMRGVATRVEANTVIARYSAIEEEQYGRRGDLMRWNRR